MRSRGGVLGVLFVIGLVVMLYFGRVTWWAGGGVVVPELSAQFEIAADGTGSTMVVTNTGRATLTNLQIAEDRWNLDKRKTMCPLLPPGESCYFPLPAELLGQPVYVFADRYPMPAAFVVPDK